MGRITQFVPFLLLKIRFEPPFLLLDTLLTLLSTVEYEVDFVFQPLIVELIDYIHD